MFIKHLLLIMTLQHIVFPITPSGKLRVKEVACAKFHSQLDKRAGI